MKRIAAAIIALTIAPTALASAPFEGGIVFSSQWGRLNVIAREPGWSAEGPAVEIECSPQLPDDYAGPYVPSVHAIATPSEARAAAELLVAAADAAEAP